ncbi:protein of unknown function [Cyclobacterium lianum]|uniref:DUF4221 domain-containing protein n=1 Tax=Cyclobacterium lianum TaxID=388280 RepID=A0A1M7PYB5_9BACT|nr:DUF4221 family protein [Cyclobacterium lianum]SHN22787.1 protein of unknown function [Cyclobacterium lianum]
MKNFLSTLLVPIFLLACKSDPSASEKVEGIDLSIDTVMIDTGEDIINLRFGIYFSGLSKDGKYLYNSGGTSPYLERINLETLEFEEKMDFETDGPNAFGAYVYGVSADVNNNLILTSWDGTSIFTRDKQKLKMYQLTGREFDGDRLEGREQFISKIIPSGDYKTVYGLTENYETSDIFFAILDEESASLQKIKLGGFEKASEFSVRHSMGGGATISPQNTEIARLGDKLVITNPVFSRIAVYDLVDENLKYYDCRPSLTASEKVGKYVGEVDSREAFESEVAKIKEEVTFLPLMYDEDNDRYLRLSLIGQSTINEAGLEEITDYQVFVSILNGAFEVIREEEIGDEVGKLFSAGTQKPFVKDGKIWLYLNVNDELAFVRLGLAG